MIFISLTSFELLKHTKTLSQKALNEEIVNQCLKVKRVNNKRSKAKIYLKEEIFMQKT